MLHSGALSRPTFRFSATSLALDLYEHATTRSCKVPHMDMCVCVCVNCCSNENQQWSGFWGSLQLARLTRFTFFSPTLCGFSSLAKIYCIFYLGVIRSTGTAAAADTATVVGGHCSPSGHHWPHPLASNPLSIWQPTETLGCACWIRLLLLSKHTHKHFVIACVSFMPCALQFAVQRVCVCRCELL